MFAHLFRHHHRDRGPAPRDPARRADPRPPAPRREPAPLPRMRWHA
jgi:hypothetical protein